MNIFIGRGYSKREDVKEYKWDKLAHIDSYDDLPPPSPDLIGKPHYVYNSSSILPFHKSKGVYVTNGKQWIKVSSNYLTAYNSARLGGYGLDHFATVEDITLSGVINRRFGKLPIGYNVDGVTLEDVFKKAYIGNVPLTVSITDNLDTHLFELGYSIETVTVGLHITKGNSDILQARLLRNGNVVTVYTNFTNTLSYTFTDIASDTTFKVLADDGNFNNVSSNKLVINFTYPWYIGTGDKNKSDISGLDKRLKWDSNFTYEFTTNNSTIYLFLPPTFTQITSILDENQFETISDWEVSIVPIQCKDGSTQNYTRYMFKNITTMTAKFTFKV